jgi:hypothetical protein
MGREEEEEVSKESLEEETRGRRGGDEGEGMFEVERGGCNDWL